MPPPRVGSASGGTLLSQGRDFHHPPRGYFTPKQPGEGEGGMLQPHEGITPRGYLGPAGGAGHFWGGVVSVHCREYIFLVGVY